MQHIPIYYITQWWIQVGVIKGAEAIPLDPISMVLARKN